MDCSFSKFYNSILSWIFWLCGLRDLTYTKSLQFLKSKLNVMLYAYILVKLFLSINGEQVLSSLLHLVTVSFFNTFYYLRTLLWMVLCHGSLGMRIIYYSFLILNLSVWMERWDKYSSYTWTGELLLCCH